MLLWGSSQQTRGQKCNSFNIHGEQLLSPEYVWAQKRRSHGQPSQPKWHGGKIDCEKRRLGQLGIEDSALFQPVAVGTCCSLRGRVDRVTSKWYCIVKNSKVISLRSFFSRSSSLVFKCPVANPFYWFNIVALGEMQKINEQKFALAKELALLSKLCFSV